MDFNEVAIFIKVTQKGSFTAAAQALGMPKSTVSAKISSLERHLGISLITRSTRKIRLTTAGQAFYLRATKAIDDILSAESALRAESLGPQGPFKITAPIDVGNTVLPSLVPAFLKKYPKVELEILLTDDRVNFLSDQVDLAIRAGELKDSSLIAKKVGEVCFSLYASPKYLKSNPPPKSIADLESHMAIVFTPIWKEGWLLKSGKKSLRIKPQNKIMVNHIKLAHELALDGAGVALLPFFICSSDVKSSKLHPILNDFKSEVAPLHLIYPASKFVPPNVRAFIEFSSQELKKRFNFE